MSPHNILVLILIIFNTPLRNGHLIGNVQHMNALQKSCENAYSCFHDLVLVCGESVSERRTFLDLCDLYEYSCEQTMVFTHVKDKEGCPNERQLM